MDAAITALTPQTAAGDVRVRVCTDKTEPRPHVVRGTRPRSDLRYASQLGVLMSHILPSLALSLATLTVLACTPRAERSGGDPNQQDTTGECSLQWREPTNSGDAVVPFSLTSSEGIGLELVSLRSRAVVDDPLAFTELHMVFRNPQDRQIEGRFEINLPSGAAISRFSMLIGDRWQEAEVVELQAARRAYEDFLHRRQDPALLEKNAGNTFSARVFPIPANSTKEIIVSYSEDLASNAEPYRLLLRGLPQLQDLDVDVIVPRANGPEHLTLRERDFMPQKDLELATGRRAAEVGLRYDRLAVARVAPDIKLPQEPISGVTLLFDTSASRAVDFRGQVARLGEIVRELQSAAGNDFDLQVLCFDQTVEPVFVGKASSFSADAQQTILRRQALGASDLTGALRYVQSHPNRHDRVLVVSDGIATAGDQERDEIRAAAKALAGIGIRRIDAVVDGGVQDEISLKQLTVAGLERDGIVVNARVPTPLLASRLLRSTRSGLQVRVPGATWVWPETLDAVQPGDQVLVFADLPPDMPLRVEIGGDQTREVPLKTAERPLLERAWVKANIDRLSAQPGTDDTSKAATRAQILELSTRYRVLSDYTALLVLETEFDYQRFNIDRTALADILTVGPAGITTIDRRQLPTKNTIAVNEPMPTRTRASMDGLARDEEEDNRDAPVGAPADAPAEAAAAPPVLEASAVGGAPASQGAPPAPPRTAAEPLADARPGAPSTGRNGDDELAIEPSRMREESKVKADRGAPAKRRPPSSSIDPSPVPERSVVDNLRPQPIEAVAPPPPRPQPTPVPQRPRPSDAYDGRFAVVMQQLERNDQGGALREATTWREQHPGDELALLALGEVAEASGDLALAARAYGSLIDLFPSRADIRRMAGQRLEALGEVGLPLAVDTYAQAVAQRPDHPSSHRLYAFALVKAGRFSEAFAAALVGSRQQYPWGRFAGVSRILDEDLRLIAAAWLAAEPGQEKTIRAELEAAGITPDQTPSVRFVLNWETDANDVDFHIYDGVGGHAYYGNRRLYSGGELYADVTTGYGPECFTISGVAPAYPYILQGHYYSRGPMGYGMGKLQVIEHDGAGQLYFKERPFVIMKDRAFVDLGQLDGPLAKSSKATRLPVAPSSGAGTGAYTPPAPVAPPTALPPARF